MRQRWRHSRLVHFFAFCVQFALSWGLYIVLAYVAFRILWRFFYLVLFVAVGVSLALLYVWWTRIRHDEILLLTREITRGFAEQHSLAVQNGGPSK